MGSAVPDPGDKYWAFISYSHADEKWAHWLRKGLEGYRVPARLVGQDTATCRVPKRLFPVFRDRDELPGSSELGPELQKALSQSRAQIVVCSPSAARSRWVNEEIKYYKSLGRASRVFALIVGGEPHAADPARECFPEALRHAVDAQCRVLFDRAVEPIAADARPGADGRHNAKLKIVSGILGVGFDDLKQRELSARNRRLAILSALTTGVAAVTMVLAVLAYQARNDAQRRRQQAEGLIEFMLGDLREKLEPIGKLDVLAAVGDKAMGYFATLDESDRTDAALLSRAKALRQIGDVRVKQGGFAGAMDAYNEALTLNAELAARHAADAETLYNVGETEFSLGTASYLKGNFDEAFQWFDRYRATADRLVTLDPGNRRWQQVVVESRANIGVIAFQHSELQRAGDLFAEARAGQRALLDAEPDNAAYINTMGQLHGWLSLIAHKQQQWQRSLEEAQQQVSLTRQLLESTPDDARYREQLVNSLHHVVYALLQQQRLGVDSPELREVLALTAEQCDRDSENIEYQRAHALSLYYLSEAHLAADSITAAAGANDESMALLHQAFARAPERLVLADDLLARLAQAAWLAHVADDDVTAQARIDEALALPLSPELAEKSASRNWLQLHLLAARIAAEPSQRDAQLQKAERAYRRFETENRPLPAWLFGYWAQRGDLARARESYRQLDQGARRHPFVRELCAAYPVCA